MQWLKKDRDQKHKLYRSVTGAVAQLPIQKKSKDCVADSVDQLPVEKKIKDQTLAWSQCYFWKHSQKFKYESVNALSIGHEDTRQHSEYLAMDKNCGRVES